MAIDIGYWFYRIIDTKFEVEASGLKKNTLFTFHFAGMDKSNECKPFGKEIGDPLYSDANGKLKFEFYFNFDEKTGYSGTHYDDTYYQDPTELGGDYNQLLLQFDLGIYSTPGIRRRTLNNLVQLKTSDGKVAARASLIGSTDMDYTINMYHGVADPNGPLRDFRYWAPQWWLDAYGLDRPNYPPPDSGP